MRKFILLLFIAVSTNSFAQSLTVDYIMRDPKWMGTSPSNVFWSHDSKTVFLIGIQNNKFLTHCMHML